MTLALHAAQEQGPDRVVLEQRVEQVPHPALVPHLASLNEREVPPVRIVSAPSSDESSHRQDLNVFDGHFPSLDAVQPPP
jgi:hypothetical protein